MTTIPRSAISDFATANPLYAGASVSFFTVTVDGQPTNTLATLYNNTVGSGTLSNPQILDSEGKFKLPVYIQEPVIGVVETTKVSSHRTGIIAPIGVWRGVWGAGETYYTNQLFQDPSTQDIYVVLSSHVASSSLADDVLAGKAAVVVEAKIVTIQDNGLLYAIGMG